MVTEFDHHRMDDDGAPPYDNRHVLRIGIAPSAPPGTEKPRPIVAGSPSGKTVEARSVGNLILPGRPEAPAEKPALILPMSARAEPEPSLTWAEYAAWRKTKCAPHDQPARATLELVGEVGELAELLLTRGPATFYGEDRAKLIDECGDVFFCASWCFDEWGKNPLVESDDLELVRVDEDDPILLFTRALAENPLEAVQHSPNFVGGLARLVYNALASMQTQAALTANACKKRIFQGREQDAEKQVGRIAAVLMTVNQILIVANSNVEEALKANRAKLDARYPDGWHASVGGGIREGAGK